MEQIYGVMDVLFPFEWAEFSFMKNAFLAVLLITPLFGLVGTMVVNNRMSFFPMRSATLRSRASRSACCSARTTICSPCSASRCCSRSAFRP